MWNTGIAYFKNSSPWYAQILDQEAQWWKPPALHPGEERYLKGIIVPWCINTWEIVDKAMIIGYPGNPPIPNVDVGMGLYLFQDYENNRVYWSDPLEGDPWNTKHYAGAGPSSYVDIEIEPKPGDPNVAWILTARTRW